MFHHSKRLIPVPPTYERIGAGLGRRSSELINSKWAFNIVRIERVAGGAWVGDGRVRAPARARVRLRAAGAPGRHLPVPHEARPGGVGCRAAPGRPGPGPGAIFRIFN